MPGKTNALRRTVRALGKVANYTVQDKPNAHDQEKLVEMLLDILHLDRHHKHKALAGRVADPNAVDFESALRAARVRFEQEVKP